MKNHTAKKNILQYLEAAKANCPDKIALKDAEVKLTYSEYCSKAQQIGSFLLHKLDGRTNQPIAVLIDRRVASVVCFLGIVYSGNFYVPIDMTMPVERIGLILNSLKPIACLDARGGVKEEQSNFVIDEILSNCELEVFTYDRMLVNAQIDSFLLQNIRDYTIDTDPLYSIFTSGSTGVPKGVLITHRGVIDLVEDFAEAFSFDENQVFGNQAPFDFDVSTKDIYNALRNQATLTIIPKKLFKTPKLLLEHLIEEKIDTMIWAVSALRILSDFKALEDKDFNPKYIMFSGEVMPAKSLNYWMKHAKNTRFINLYGPTEITCNCTYYEVRNLLNEDKSIPIGKAFSNSRVMLLDENKREIIKEKIVGEIHVAGSGLALGYYNNSKQTEDAFIDNPNQTAYRERLYATGDMAYYNDDNDLVFASRKDDQIKHMGHRIEIGEIEVALNAVPFVRNAVCIYNHKTERIVCCYESDEECKKEIVMALSQKLPKYMWPNVYNHFESLPMTKNGKVNRVKLREDILS